MRDGPWGAVAPSVSAAQHLLPPNERWGERESCQEALKGLTRAPKTTQGSLLTQGSPITKTHYPHAGDPREAPSQDLPPPQGLLPNARPRRRQKGDERSMNRGGAADERSVGIDLAFPSPSSQALQRPFARATSWAPSGRTTGYAQAHRLRVFASHWVCDLHGAEPGSEG
jgi:hypothetical protein